ncbi:unnamed protein product [Triticum turgidum subsp. durum]|uniref:Plant heme peroxidase family profile domain-containing protein n=1 Tax=Triticum turgidum subsp. durum TaxID=4567 RepID=A0A9R1B8V3_TRITD|nr:unnamed protein product [Triticum turgidum subsp. durum]
MQEAVRELPSPSMTFPQLVALFAGKGLDVRDLVWLSGCAHHRHRPLLVLRGPPLQLPQRRQRHRDRPAPRRRLRGQPAAAQVQDGRPRHHGGDGPRQLPDVRPRLLPHCAEAQGPVPVRRRAGHRSRGAGRHRRVVSSPPEVFFQVFAWSMARLGAVQVKTGSQGEIRKHCAVVNS